jgi:hypothetical protein
MLLSECGDPYVVVRYGRAGSPKRISKRGVVLGSDGIRREHNAHGLDFREPGFECIAARRIDHPETVFSECNARQIPRAVVSENR